jgi:DNA repair protein RadC
MNTHVHAADQIAEITLSYVPRIPLSSRPLVLHAQHAYELLRERWNPDTIQLIEEMKVMYLNRANRVLGICTISSGGLCATIADPRIILAAALKGAATSIILAHNHPSGNVLPSNQDKVLTTKLCTAARYHDITVADHLIISADGYFSFSDEGLL